MVPMQKQELLSILITFVVGFFAGGYLYVNHFLPMVQPEGVGTREEQGAFEITSQAYGSCGSDCPAFRVASDGSFRYQYSEAVGAEPTLESGRLPRSLRRELAREITTQAIAIQTTEVGSANCASNTNGIDIRYDIMIGGATYRLDSCRTAVDFDSDAWQTLNDVWAYFTELSQ